MRTGRFYNKITADRHTVRFVCHNQRTAADAGIGNFLSVCNAGCKIIVAVDNQRTAVDQNFTGILNQVALDRQLMTVQIQRTDNQFIVAVNDRILRQLLSDILALTEVHLAVCRVFHLIDIQDAFDCNSVFTRIAEYDFIQSAVNRNQLNRLLFRAVEDHLMCAVCLEASVVNCEIAADRDRSGFQIMLPVVACKYKITLYLNGCFLILHIQMSIAICTGIIAVYNQLALIHIETAALIKVAVDRQRIFR